MNRSLGLPRKSSSKFVDFTVASYRKLLSSAAKRYSFEFFGSSCTTPHVLWRHDVDLSVHRALKLAEIESRMGVRSTYFFLLRGDFYNLLEIEVTRRAQRIVELGHRAGLHFDPKCYPECTSPEMLKFKVRWEKRVLENVLSAPVGAFSLHDPSPQSLNFFSCDRIAGMTNAYGKSIRQSYEYCSDSNGYWRHERLMDVLTKGDSSNLQVLTHPEWWVPTPMSPWQRIIRCVDGRAKRVLSNYDNALKRDGRVNLGK